VTSTASTALADLAADLTFLTGETLATRIVAREEEWESWAAAMATDPPMLADRIKPAAMPARVAEGMDGKEWLR
jgi:hypothetical protein